MLGVVGAGYWGKNLVRNFEALGALHTVCDHHTEIRERYPGVHTTQDFKELLAQEAITAVVIATPAPSHYALAVQALESGRDLFVEKPLCLSVAEGERLVALAQERGLVLMVGHILNYHPAVERLQALLKGGVLGELQYVSAHRLDLGNICFRENALGDKGPHDISLILSLVGSMPTKVRCSGGAYLTDGISDQTVTTLEFANGVTGHILSSWMHPFKEHRLSVIGSEGMAVFDDTRPWGEKLALYRNPIEWVDGVPKTVRVEPEFQVLEEKEPLREECAHFLHCCQERTTPRTDGAEGVRVLQVLEAAHRSLTPVRNTYIAPKSASV